MRTVLVLLVLLAVPTATAQESVPETLVQRSGRCEVTICVPGRYEFHYIHNTDFVIDADGNKHGVLDLGLQRWRLRPRMTFSKDLFIEMETDLLTGQVFGDVTSSSQDFAVEPTSAHSAFDVPEAVALRALYLSWRSPIGLFRIGHMTSHYGYGLVANNGDDEDHAVFDSPRAGDIVERILYATKPLKLFMDSEIADAVVLAGGFDVVFRDENANLLEGDLAMQGVVSLNYRTEPLTVGVYMAFRTQEDDDGDALDAQAYDLFVKWVHPLADLNGRLTLGAELAFINAHTDRVISEQARQGVDVTSMGAVFRARLELDDPGIETRLEVGWASGDNNRSDDRVRSFSFDPSYQVGMILFSEVMARVSARTVDLIRDPDIAAVPPEGVELVATDGKITNTVYVNPVVRWRSNIGLGFDAGALFAWSEADLVDSWASAQNGGYNYNYLGKALDSDSRYLGTELNLGMRYTFDIRAAVAFVLGVQGGVFLPGSAFEAADGTSSLADVFKVRTNFEVRF